MKARDLQELQAIAQAQSTWLTLRDVILSMDFTPSPVGSHVIHSRTKLGEHYRIANDYSWCTCKGFTYRQTCVHTVSPQYNIVYEV